jgi:hypothetical protein
MQKSIREIEEEMLSEILPTVLLQQKKWQLFLASPAAAYINGILPVDGGRTGCL